MITNVGFTDTSGSGYWIDGTVTWVAPDNPAFEYFRIVMVPARVMISPRAAVYSWLLKAGCRLVYTT